MTEEEDNNLKNLMKTDEGKILANLNGLKLDAKQIYSIGRLMKLTRQEERTRIKAELDAIVKTAVLELHNETTILNNIQKLAILLEKRV